MNPNLALIFLGISIGITTVLDITGVFTNCWFSDGRNCTGIVPFDSTEPAWLAATSWMLFVSVAVIAGWSYWVTLSSIFAIGNVQVFAKAVQPHCIAT
ncbi:hypothetical protein GCK72_016029 [Caenorhabditis remanei]|uniref:Uncharacterized protein n=1 Tax=Caenorhabditis remanei TaxID=31234 RepID=A0A6A5GZ39_CAERE|nr:hypothetical protein GCK72_016029 [Caenorhabditis remanei]KAF1759562.1 hypothetical protein GCK72_016029 [Caenorhabditis remanei]